MSTPDLSNKELWANGWMINETPIEIVLWDTRLDNPGRAILPDFPKSLHAITADGHLLGYGRLVRRPVKRNGFIAIRPRKPKELCPFIAYASHVYATEDELSSECGDVVIPIEWEEPAQ